MHSAVTGFQRSFTGAPKPGSVVHCSLNSQHGSHTKTGHVTLSLLTSWSYKNKKIKKELYDKEEKNKGGGGSFLKGGHRWVREGVGGIFLFLG